MRSCRNRALSFAVLAAFFGATRVFAIDFAVGAAGVDGMDDHMQPAVSARIGWAPDLYSQLYYWGRDYGPVSERDVVLTFTASAPVASSKFLVAHYGITASAHDISLYDNPSSRAQPDPPPATHDRDLNLGGMLGMGLRAKTGPLTYAVNWDSHIYLTASPFIVFLASARKQIVSIMLGVEL